MKPLAVKCEKDLEKYQLHNAQMKEMIRRFDELISDKVNKYTHKTLEDYVNATFLPKARWDPIQEEFEAIRTDSKQMLAEVKAHMKGQSENM